MIPIEYGKYYHIFNRGNNFENIFNENSDYSHFLELLDIYISSVAEIYSWVLLKNHFHLLVRIKEENEIGFLNSENINSNNLRLKWNTYDLETIIPAGSSDEGRQSKLRKFKKKPIPYQQFKHFFNTYAKQINKKHNRAGSLFLKNFKRKLIDNERYLKDLIVYIHNNPVHHKFTEQIADYKWSSYQAIISKKKTKLFRKNVLEYFNDRDNFIFVHRNKKEFDDIEEYLIE